MALSILPKMKDYLIERFAYIDVKVASDTMAPYIVSGRVVELLFLKRNMSVAILLFLKIAMKPEISVNHIYPHYRIAE